jgi:HEPN domain-containing protein
MARRWLSKARTDLAAAGLILQRGPDLEPWAAVFHAQQAAEKAIKALLIANSINPPYVHDLVELTNKLPAGAKVGASAEQLARLNDLSAGTRYVGLLEQRDPSWEEAETAVGVASTVLEAVTAQLRGR